MNIFLFTLIGVYIGWNSSQPMWAKKISEKAKSLLMDKSKSV